jgi:hypothetical protein
MREQEQICCVLKEASMRRHKPLGSDTGLLVLHWGAVALLFTSLFTGLRVGADRPGNEWINTLSPILPDGDVWPFHVWAGIGLAIVTISYAIYIRRSGLGNHVKLGRGDIASLARGGRARWNAVHAVLVWLVYGMMLSQLVTGFLLYFGRGGILVDLHYWVALAFLAFPVAHVASQFAIGGWRQVLRIFRPQPMAPVSAKQDFTNLLLEAYLAQEKSLPAEARPAAAGAVKVLAPRTTGSVASAHPAAVAAAAAFAFGAVVFPLDRGLEDRLTIGRISDGAVPALDGDLSDPVWKNARQVSVETIQGVNQKDGLGESTVDIRAVSDGKHVYFAFTWDDPNRSLKHLPLIKKEDGWHLLHTDYDIEDEDSFYEDKFGVMFSHSREPGGGTAHLGKQPLKGMPAAYSGRGLHYTTDGSKTDVWHWKAARGGMLGIVDDNYFAAPKEPKPEEAAGKTRYKAGYATDEGKVFYKNNFKHESAGGYRGPVKVEKLPKDYAAVNKAMGRIDLDPDTGEDENAKWWMTEDEVVAYSAEADKAIPVGTVIPGVLIAGKYEGDRADVKGVARWAAGRWTLEAVRLVDTGNKGDLPFADGLAMWVSPFDHSQTRHTRHMRPIIMEFEQ